MIWPVENLSKNVGRRVRLNLKEGVEPHLGVITGFCENFVFVKYEHVDGIIITHCRDLEFVDDLEVTQPNIALNLKESPYVQLVKKIARIFQAAKIKIGKRLHH